MKSGLLQLLLASSLLLLVACGGGGSSSGGGSSGGVSGSASTSTTSAPIINTSVDPVPYSDAEEIFPFVTKAVIQEDGRAVIDFQLTDGFNVAILDLSAEDIRLIIAKLQNNPIGNLAGNWQSYINKIEQPGVGEGTEAKLQATTESGTQGELTNNLNGTYRYRFAASVKSIPAAIAEQARQEGLNLSYQDKLTHRVAIQFSNSKQPANPTYDWVPRNGQTDYIFHLDVTATANCNNCHDKLAYHGGGRVETKYCVTCHNPGTSDANSGNSLDFKQMVHKIHMGSKLPSVENGERYILWGFNDTPNDYSEISYPGDILACERCHAGTASDPGDDSLQLTHQGDNWREFSQRSSCGSCHDGDPNFFDKHYGGQPTNENCMSCHGLGGAADTVATTHINPNAVARSKIAADILYFDQTMAGEFPVVTFRVYNPENGRDYDILNDPIWQNGSLSVKLGWSTGDYTNVGNQSSSAATISIDTKTLAQPVGDGSFLVHFADADPPKPIPDESIAPGIAATGSGAAVVEGRASFDVDGDGNDDRVPLTNAVAFYAISDAQAVPRRQSVELARCKNCHDIISFHGNSRTDNIDSCLTCHNPRYSTTKVSATANFKPMIHRIHTETLRTTDDGEERPTRYPGDLANCLGCHNEDGYKLPLPEGVLATTVDPGTNIPDPSDDRVTTPITSACSDCHNSTEARSHMVDDGGGNFNTTQAQIDNGTVVEQCNNCHSTGRTYAVETVHGLD